MKSRNSEPQTPESVYQYALRLLTARDYSCARMRSKLAGRGVCESDIESTMLRLQNEGWIDDFRFAGRFAETALSTGRFYGPRLRLEMRRRGFEADLITGILGALLSESDEVSEVRSALARRYQDFCFSAASDRDRRRVIGFLQRRGFGLSSIMRALRTKEESY